MSGVTPFLRPLACGTPISADWALVFTTVSLLSFSVSLSFAALTVARLFASEPTAWSRWDQRARSPSLGNPDWLVGLEPHGAFICILRSRADPAGTVVDQSSRLLGFRYETRDIARPGRPPSPVHTGTALLVPYWFLWALTGILPMAWLWRWRRNRHLKSDGMPHCAKCDYNLTGNVSGICPECGTPIPADLVRKPIQ